MRSASGTSAALVTHGADGRRREQPAVAVRADMQDVLREDRQQRGRRREERREEIQQHRRADERRAEHEAQAFERRAPRHDRSRALAAERVLAAGTSRIISSATITHPNETALST